MKKSLALILGVTGLLAIVWWLWNTDAAPSLETPAAKTTAQHAVEPVPSRSTANDAHATVTLRVIRATDDSPVAEARLQFSAARHADSATQSDRNGDASRIAVPAKAGLTLNISCNGYVPVTRIVKPLEPKEHRDLGVVRLTRTVPTEIRVLSFSDDTSIADALVEAFGADRSGEAHADDESSDFARRWTASTDETGRVVFPAATAGRWTFRASKTGFATGFSRNTASGGTSITLPEGSRGIVLTLRLMPGHELPGRVVDQFGEGRGGVALIAGSMGTRGVDVSAQRTVSAADGSFALSGLTVGYVQLRVAPDGTGATQVIPVQVPTGGPLEIVVPRGGVLHGRVTDADTGDVVADARVTVLGRGIGRNVSVTTEVDGTYRFDSLPPLVVEQVIVGKSGYAPCTPLSAQGVTQLPLRAGSVHELNAALVRGATLTGVVRGPQGPVPFARVQPIRLEQKQGIDVGIVTADAEGRYRFDGLRPGPIVLLATRPGWFSPDFPQGLGWQDALDGKPGFESVATQIGASGSVELDLRLARAVTLRGIVLAPDGSPSPAATVVIGQSGYGAADRRVAVQPDGTFELVGVLPDRPAVIWAEHPTLYAAQSVRIPDPGTAAQRPLRLRLVNRAIVAGRVRCAAGHDLSGAVVRVWSTSGRESIEGPSAADGTAPVRLQSDGTFSVPIPGTTGGTFRVRVDAPGHRCPQSRAHPIRPGETTQLDIVLNDFTSIAGEVRSSDGRPLAGARLAVGNYGNTTVAVADREGRFRLDDIHLHWGGSYETLWLWALAPGHASARVRVDAENRTHVRIELKQQRTIAGIVRRRDGTALGGVIVSARPADGARVFAFVNGAFAGEALTANDGTFTIDGLDDGRYLISVRSPPGRTSAVVPAPPTLVAAGASGVELRVDVAAGAGFEGPHAHLSTAELARNARGLMIGRRDYARAVLLWEELLTRPLGDEERARALAELSTAEQNLPARDRSAARLQRLRSALAAAPQGSAVRARAAQLLAEELLTQGEDLAYAVTVLNDVIASSPAADVFGARHALVRVLHHQGDTSRALTTARNLAADLPRAAKYDGLRVALRGLILQIQSEDR